MKFKVGDKVKLKEDFSEFIIRNANYTRNLLEECDTFTVDYVDEYYDAIGLKEVGGAYMWGSKCFEKVENEMTIFDNIEISCCGKSTVAKYNEGIGISFRNKYDKEDRKVGILIAVMRALGFDKVMVNKVVDVLFDDIKELKDYTDKELLEEISRKMK